jgi:hypothetical protein
MQFQLHILLADGSGSTPRDCPSLREGKGPKTKLIAYLFHRKVCTSSMGRTKRKFGERMTWLI